MGNEQSQEMIDYINSRPFGRRKIFITNCCIIFDDNAGLYFLLTGENGSLYPISESQWITLKEFNCCMLGIEDAAQTVKENVDILSEVMTDTRAMFQSMLVELIINKEDLQ